MKNRAVVLAAIVGLLIACQSGGPGREGAARLVLVSYDGLGADLLESWLSGGLLDQPDGLRAMVEQGRSADSLRMVNPTLTAVNHVTLATGREPSETGIVSNSFRRIGSRFPERLNGFDAPVAVETIWTAAQRQGKRVGVLLWPGSDASAINRIADFGLIWPVDPLARSLVIDLDPATASAQPELPTNDGVAAMSWVVSVDLDGAAPGDGDYLVAVMDGAPDGVSRFDQIGVRKVSDPHWALMGAREWFSMIVDAAGSGDLRVHPYGAWCKSMRLDRNTGAIRLLRGAFWRLEAYPTAFQDALVEAVGPWPGHPDRHLIAEWWNDAGAGIDLDTYLEQAERLDRYIDAIAAHTFATEDFDFILTYHPIVDEYLHANMISDPRQWAYSPGKALAGREGLKRVSRSVDLSVAKLWQLLNPDQDVLVVVSDHGLAPLTDVIRVNQLLADAGLVKVEEHDGRKRVAADSPMIAQASGGCAHIYLNLIGREPRAAVYDTAAMGMLLKASRVLADLEVDDLPVVEKIFNRQEAVAIGLGHRDCGDLVVFLNPGFTASNSLRGGAVEASTSYAQHGYLNHHSAMNGIFLARGARIKPERIKQAYAPDVAPTVAFWLGIRFP